MADTESTTRPVRGRRPDVVTVEIDQGSTSARNRPAGQAWFVRLRRADHTVIINTGLGRASAEHLARQIDRLLQPEPAAPNPTIHRSTYTDNLTGSRVAKDRVISTVDPDARHGHKTVSRGFDGYKGHAAVDPDSEIITVTTVTPGNTGDAAAAADLITDLTDSDTEQGEQGPIVYGDAAYGTGEFHERLDGAGIESRCKTQAPTAAGGLFPKDRFAIDLGAQTATCPAGVTAAIRPARSGDGSGIAYFGQACAGCPLRAQCSTAKAGRTINIGAHEQELADARARQADPAWVADYRATRPKVERKLGHLMRRKHGGRRARVRGTDRVDADFRFLAGAINLARLATLRVRGTATGWAVAS